MKGPGNYRHVLSVTSCSPPKLERNLHMVRMMDEPPEDLDKKVRITSFLEGWIGPKSLKMFGLMKNQLKLIAIAICGKP